jgi:FtsH-binding integral membrane protein
MENPIDKLSGMAGNLTDVQGQMDAVKAKGEAFKQKVKDLGMGGGAVLVLGILAQLLFPWWSCAIVAFYVGIWIADSPGKSYAYGFAAMLLMWSVYAGFQSLMNGGLIGTAFSNVFGGKISSAQLISATGFIGGLVGGFSAMTGTMLRDLFRKEAVQNA